MITLKYEKKINIKSKKVKEIIERKNGGQNSKAKKLTKTINKDRRDSILRHTTI